MKIVIAPQTFKGSISALDVAAAMAEGVRRVVPDADTDLVPVADGGDGTLETLVDATGGEVHTAVVTGPLGDTVEAGWGALGDGRTAVVEMARTSGLALVPPDKRDPLAATTRGLGEIIAQALDAGFRSFIVGIGGSATNGRGSRHGPGPGSPAAGLPGKRPAARRRRAGPAGPHRHVGARPKGARVDLLGRLRRQQPTDRARGCLGGLRPAEGGDPGDGRAARRRSLPPSRCGGL